MTDDVTDPTDPTDPAGDPSTLRTRRGPARRRWLVAGSASVVAAAAIVGVLVVADQRDTPRVAADAAPASTSTTAISSTSTTLPPIPDVDRWETAIASATGASVEAFADRPQDRSGAAGTDDQTAIGGDQVATLVRERQQREAGWAAHSSGPKNGEIPALDRPVDGRERTPAGWIFTNPSGWGGRLTFTVTEDHGDWLKVMLPVRPNGTEGWIRAADVSLSRTRFHVHIAVEARTLTVFDGDTLLLSTPVVVGKDSTATPRGRFYVTDAVEKYSGSSYGPWILPLSGFSQSLDEFGGGVPVIAIHGTNHPELAGTAASNGCIRVPSDETITQMHDQLPLGTPVDITD